MRLFTIILLLWSTNSWADIPRSFAHRIYEQGGNNSSFHFSQIVTYEEVEFEDINTEEYLDLFDYREFDASVEFRKVFKKNYQFGLGMVYTYKGNAKKRYQEFEGMPTVYLEPKGFKKASIFGARTFVADKFIHTVKAELLAGPTGKEDRTYNGGIDLYISYHFLYDVKPFSPFFEIYNLASFPKKMIRMDGETEKQNAYSEVFTRVGLLYQREKFYSIASLGFGLMTDYEIESPSYHRVADKGFRTYWKLGAGYRFSKSWELQAQYIRSSQVFNSKNHDPRFTDVDYEIEEDVYKLELIWAF